MNFVESQPQPQCQSQRQCPDYLRNESAIVWTEDIAALPYVRSMVFPVSSRDQPPVQPGFAGADRVVGYGVLRPDAPPLVPGVYRRRVFWLAAGDRTNDPEGAYRVSCPEDAVDPYTIAPGEPGRLTERAFPTLQSMRFPAAAVAAGAADKAPEERTRDQ